jgi:hypothetical protein
MREMTTSMLMKALFFKVSMWKLPSRNFAPISEEFAEVQFLALFVLWLMSARLFHARVNLVRNGSGNVFASAQCDHQIATGPVQRLCTAKRFSEQRYERADAELPRPSMANL